jgi:hypothetical protein
MSLVSGAMARLAGSGRVTEIEQDGRTIQRYGVSPDRLAPQALQPLAAPALPAWLSQTAPPETASRILSPSRLTAAADSIKAEIATQQQKWNDSFKAEFLAAEAASSDSPTAGLTPEQQADLKKSVDEATAAFRTSLASVESQIAELSPAYSKLQSELAFWQSEFERELNGQRSGMAGEGPRAKSIRSDQLDWRRTEVKRLGALLDAASAEKSGLDSRINDAMKAATDAFDLRLAADAAKNAEEAKRIADLRRRIQQDQAAQFVTQQNGIRAAIRQVRDRAGGRA